MTAATRQVIVDALATVAGVVAHPSIPNAPSKGDAWPVWERGEFRNGKLVATITHTYSAFVILPAAYEPETVEAADGLVSQVMTALDKIGTVDVAEPVTIPVDAHSTHPAIRVRLTVFPC